MQPTKRFGLPPYFKTIGLALALLPVLFLGITKLLYDDPAAHFGDNKQLIVIIAENLMLLGLAFIAAARTKAETERLMLLRMTTAISAFAFCIIFSIWQSFNDLWFADDVTEVYSANNGLTTGLIFYLVVFEVSKKRQAK